MHHLRAIQALLTLVLLEQKVVSAVAIEGKFTASGLPNSLLRAAVGLELWHTDEKL